MKLADHAKSSPDKPAIIEETGKSLSFIELDEQSTQLAHLLTSQGLVPGDNVAILLKNCIDYFIIAWAAQRSGLYFTPINWHLTSDEISYILGDCDAKILFADARIGELAVKIKEKQPSLTAYYSCNGQIEGFQSLHHSFASQSREPANSEPAGLMMLYSSGTTGFPKGIKRPLSGNDYSEPLGLESSMTQLWHFDRDSIYLSPAPLYHAAPLGWSMSTQKLGGTVVVMDKFEAETFLDLIPKHAVSHTQCVPTMFAHMLNLPTTIRDSFDLSSLKFAIHAAAPCPIVTKENMLDWWGPIIHEFYSGSEGFGLCAIDAVTWLSHKGSVGKSLIGNIHIVDDKLNELPVGDIGTIYFENPAINFHYHNDPEKTQACQLHTNWATFGDVGYLDEDGFLYLVDRRTDLIISGGVNIYPSETENALRLHPAVFDVAVIGRPDPVLGEQVIAILELNNDYNANNQLSEELIKFCQQKIAKFKCPRAIEYAILPRTATGKLLRRKLKENMRG